MERRVAGVTALDNMLRLLAHSDDKTHSVSNFQIAYALNHAGELWLRYHVDAEPAYIVIEEAKSVAERADKLWESTCFECFVKRPTDRGYIELNFSTARRWAAYSFQEYRGGMQNQSLSATPDIYQDFSDSHFALEARLQLPERFIGQEIDMAITAIIAEKDGAKSHWSLAHPPGKPDFHHEACFALKLAPPLRP